MEHHQGDVVACNEIARDRVDSCGFTRSTRDLATKDKPTSPNTPEERIANDMIPDRVAQPAAFRRIAVFAQDAWNLAARHRDHCPNQAALADHRAFLAKLRALGGK